MVWRTTRQQMYFLTTLLLMGFLLMGCGAADSGAGDTTDPDGGDAHTKQEERASTVSPYASQGCREAHDRALCN
jgi:hypothetical protein